MLVNAAPTPCFSAFSSVVMDISSSEFVFEVSDDDFKKNDAMEC